MVDKRLAAETTRPQFMTYILRHKEEGYAMTLERDILECFPAHARRYRPTASRLSGTTQLLLRSSNKLRKLNEAVRAEVKSIEDITMQAPDNLPYLLTVLSDCIRRYPLPFLP